MSADLCSSCTKADFQSNIQVRWCPGCGDYAILAAIQSLLPKLGRKREDIAFVSGIGCSSRFPYYMNTYGFHTIHGRAPAIATGLKAVNPDLLVWVVTGDGDGLSIGGNHLLHALRRNVDLKILFFNNEIYGLTKGQLSPTSKTGSITPTSPFGAVEAPINPIAFALTAGATFVARTLDTDVTHMQQVFEAAARHKGVAFIEILQNCVIFNDKTHDHFAGRANRKEGMLVLEHGKPLAFGEKHAKGIFAEGLQLKAKVIPDSQNPLIHDAVNHDSMLAMALAQFRYPQFPVPIGIFRQWEELVYHEKVQALGLQQQAQKGVGQLDELFRDGPCWTVG